MNLIIIQQDELDGGRVVLSDDRARHIRKVLKAEPGKALRIGLLNGPLGTGLVESIDEHAVTLQCDFENVSSTKPRVDLLVAMPRPKVMKRLWAQIAALGVGQIVLLRADKVERYYFDSHVLDPEFYNKLLIEGLQQACCTHLPEVSIRPRFKPFVEDELAERFAHHHKLLADPSGQKDWAGFTSSWTEEDRVLLAIGPEGGWTAYELDMLEDHGFERVGMGHRILRTDTATIGLISLVTEYLNR